MGVKLGVMSRPVALNLLKAKDDLPSELFVYDGLKAMGVRFICYPASGWEATLVDAPPVVMRRGDKEDFCHIKLFSGIPGKSSLLVGALGNKNGEIFCDDSTLKKALKY